MKKQTLSLDIWKKRITFLFQDFLDIHIHNFYQVCNIYIYAEAYLYKPTDVIFVKIHVSYIGFNFTYVKHI